MKVIKWLFIGVGGLIVLMILTLLIVPMFVDIGKYKPEIEKRVAEATGRPFTLGGDLELSLFPWAGLSFSDLHLGNPPGFTEKDFVSVDSFEVRVKLIPLLSKDIQVRRFILEGPRIVLEKNKDGRGNWEGLGKPSEKVAQKETPEKVSEGEPSGGLPIESLTVGECAVKNGSLLWIDQGKGERKEIKDLLLRLEDVSFDRPISLSLSALVDERPLELKGKVGPLGKEPGKGVLPLDLTVKAFKELELKLNGKLTDPASSQRYDLSVDISPFSPRKLVEAMGQSFPVKTQDPKALDRISLKARLAGDPKNVAISDGLMQLDGSKLEFKMTAKEFSKPDLAFDLNLDQIDVDRYLPPQSEEKPAKTEEERAPKRERTDYAPLRKLVLDGTIRMGKVKVNGAKIEDIYLKVTGKNGRFDLDPLSLKLYQGHMDAKGTFDVSKDTPRSEMSLQAKGVQVGPLLKDTTQKEVLEGQFMANMDMRMAGDDPEKVKKSLNGKGDLVFNDGAIVGIDLAGMVRNIKAKFGLAEATSERPRTDFSELKCPFTITNGVLDTKKTSLVSPLLRVLAAGEADLVQETLDFRVEPKFVATIKGQGDTQERSGISVPVLVSGTFSSPKFSPDLEGMFKSKMDQVISDPGQVDKLLKGSEKEKDIKKPAGETPADLFKSLPFGRNR
jgi:AsmA protein